MPAAAQDAPEQVAHRGRPDRCHRRHAADDGVGDLPHGRVCQRSRGRAMGSQTECSNSVQCDAWMTRPDDVLGIHRRSRERTVTDVALTDQRLNVRHGQRPAAPRAHDTSTSPVLQPWRQHRLAIGPTGTLGSNTGDSATDARARQRPPPPRPLYRRPPRRPRLPTTTTTTTVPTTTTTTTTVPTTTTHDHGARPRPPRPRFRRPPHDHGSDDHHRTWCRRPRRRRVRLPPVAQPTSGRRRCTTTPERRPWLRRRSGQASSPSPALEDVVPIGAIALMLMTSGSGLLWAGSRRRRHDGSGQDED